MPRGGFFEALEDKDLVGREPLFNGGQGRARKDVGDSAFSFFWAVLFGIFILVYAVGCKGAEPDLENELFDAADKFVTAHCKAHGLDPATEKALWVKAWDAKVDGAIQTGAADSEAAYLQRVTLAKRGSLSASADYFQVLEACRILLRWRDAKIELLQSIRGALTPERVASIRALLEEKSK